MMDKPVRKKYWMEINKEKCIHDKARDYIEFSIQLFSFIFLTFQVWVRNPNPKKFSKNRYILNFTGP